MALIGKIRRRFGVDPPFAAARKKLGDAIAGGQLSTNSLLSQNMPQIDNLLGGDSLFEGPDWIEIEMWAEELRIEVKKVGDLLALPQAIDRTY